MTSYRYPQDASVHKVDHSPREKRALIFPPYKRDEKWNSLPDALREKGLNVRPWTVYAPSGIKSTWSVKGFSDIAEVLDVIKEQGMGEPSEVMGIIPPAPQGGNTARLQAERDNGEERSR